MIALINALCHNNNVPVKQFFRAAYHRQYGKDMPPNSLQEDVDAFQYRYEIPDYVVAYVVSLYGQV